MKTLIPTQKIAPLLPKIKSLLQGLYGDRLLDVILFGSFARNQADEDSDIDIAVVLQGKVNKSQEIDRMYDVLYDLMLDTGELISVYPLSAEEMENKNWPLYYHLKNEGIKK